MSIKPPHNQNTLHGRHFIVSLPGVPFKSVKPCVRFQFSDGHLTGNYYRKLARIVKSPFGYNWNACGEQNPSYFIWVNEDDRVIVIE